MRTEVMEGPGGGWLVLIPQTRRERVRGLRGRPPPGPRQAMLFVACRSVHTFGMRQPITVAFLDGRLRVVGSAPVRPRRVLMPRRGAGHILECGIAADLRVGDRFRPVRRARR